MTTVFIECLAFRFRVGQDKEFWVKTLFFFGTTIIEPRECKFKNSFLIGLKRVSKVMKVEISLIQKKFLQYSGRSDHFDVSIELLALMDWEKKYLSIQLILTNYSDLLCGDFGSKLGILCDCL